MTVLAHVKAWLAGVVSKLKPSKRAPSYPTGYQDLAQWQYTPLGQQVIADQQHQLDVIVSDVFGYHLLEMSSLDVRGLSASSPINHCFHLSLTSSAKPILSTAGARTHFEELPLADDTVDVVLLHHALEFSNWPHQVLREAVRVSIPHGHIVICGFNPWSLQGLVSIFARWFSKDVFWQRTALQKSRLLDWLRLLDCEPVSCYRGFYRPPINSQAFIERLSFLENLCRYLRVPFAGYYIVVARKEVVLMTPLKPRWSSLAPVTGLVVGRPAARVNRSGVGE